MFKTQIGLPNSCHDCGEPVTDYWYAINEDAAICGGGKCGKCSGMESPAEPVVEIAPVEDAPAAKPTRRRKA